MTEFKLPEPLPFTHIETEDGALFPEDVDIYTHDLLIKTLTDLGDAIAYYMGSPTDNYELVIKRYVKGLLT